MVEATGWCEFSERQTKGIDGDEADQWQGAMIAAAPSRLIASIGAVVIRGWKVAKFGVRITKGMAPAVKDWLWNGRAA